MPKNLYRPIMQHSWGKADREEPLQMTLTEKILAKTGTPFKIRPEIWVCLFLVVVTLTAYFPVRHYEFINFDDDAYITDNPYVRKGFTWQGVVWAFGFTDIDYWFPLTWLSHMLDCHLYGLNPGMHHSTNLIFHIANSLLLFLVFKRMTGARWQSAFVAMIFAIHPLNVDSVAWVAERKNVLSTFLWMLTLLAYVRYTEYPRFSRYLPVVLFSVLGLMAKSMLMTLPFVLLLLDHWPLERFQSERAGALLVEKAPLFVLSLISFYVSSLSLQHLGAVVPIERVSMGLRVENALVSYVAYIGKMVWPENLTVYYPYPETIPWWQTAGAGLLLGSISFMAIRTVKKIPYFGTGWLWYLGTLLPVIGLKQSGVWGSMADRFAYIPLIGLFIIIAWGGAALAAGWPYRKLVLPTTALFITLMFVMVTNFQVRYWKNSITLFEHALDITPGTYVVHSNLGNALARRGRLDEAIKQYAEALRLAPGMEAEVHNNLGAALIYKGKFEEAAGHLRIALQKKPDYIEARKNLEIALKARLRRVLPLSGSVRRQPR